jgi:hypothetical protein
MRLFSRHHFKILYSEKKVFRPFQEKSIENFEWMLFSQPVFKYFNEKQYEAFSSMLYSEWAKSPIDLISSQAIFIAGK